MSNITQFNQGKQAISFEWNEDYENFVATSKAFAEEIQILSDLILTETRSTQKLVSVIRKLANIHLEVCQTESDLMTGNTEVAA